MDDTVCWGSTRREEMPLEREEETDAEDDSETLEEPEEPAATPLVGVVCSSIGVMPAATVAMGGGDRHA